MSHPSSPSVGLFVTCLVDFFRPTVGFATLKLLEDAGCQVHVPKNQTCCGQPGYNNGMITHPRALARQVIKNFEHFDYVVVPSGSCTGMIKTHYPELFIHDPVWSERTRRLCDKTYELTSFLIDVLHINHLNAHFPQTITYHNSCSGLRELGIDQQPKRLLQLVSGLTLKESQDTEVCCGFGGTFCVKYTDISDKMVTNKCHHIVTSGASTLLSGDLGCLLNISGKLRRDNHPVQVRHIAEVCANMTNNVPAIGYPQT